MSKLLHSGAILVATVLPFLETGPVGASYGHAQNNTTGPSRIFDVKQHAASGSDRSTLGSIARGEGGLKIDAPLDFMNGQGIKIEHAGAACHLGGIACPIAPRPVVAIQGSPGSTTYTYQLAIVDEGGGVGPAGPAVTINNGPSLLSTRNYNLIRWEPSSAARGYALYRNNRLLLVLSGLTPEGYYDPPRGPAFTSSFKDMGIVTPAVGHPDVPIAPPNAALPDALVTTVISGAGTTLLRLRDQASSSIQKAVVEHDDSEAIQSTFDAAISGATVYFPAGSYRFTRPGFFIRRSHIKVLGENGAAVLQDNLIGNGFQPWTPPVPCGFLSPVDEDVEISSLTLSGLAPFGSSMTRRKKGICATGSFESLKVHDVVARNISGEAIYAEDLKPGEVTFSSNTIEDCAKNGLNTNSAALAEVVITGNVIRKVNGAAILVVSKRALVSGNKITGGAPTGADAVNVAVASFFTIAGNEITGVDTSLAATSLIHVGFHGSGLNGTGLVAGNIIRDNQTLNETGGGAILVDDVSAPVLIENNLVERNGRCCHSQSPAISIANKADNVFIVNNAIRGSEKDQDVGIRIENSVAAGNHISIGTNDIETPQPFVFKVKANGGPDAGYSELLRQASKWPKPQ